MAEAQTWILNNRVAYKTLAGMQRISVLLSSSPALEKSIREGWG